LESQQEKAQAPVSYWSSTEFDSREGKEETMRVFWFVLVALLALQIYSVRELLAAEFLVVSFLLVTFLLVGVCYGLGHMMEEMFGVLKVIRQSYSSVVSLTKELVNYD
jgi:hypothetical protein